MSSPTLDVIHCTTTEDVQRCVAIRVEVFVKEQGFRLKDEMDGYVYTSIPQVYFITLLNLSLAFVGSPLAALAPNPLWMSLGRCAGPPPSRPRSKDALADHLLLTIDGADAGTVRWQAGASKVGRLAVLLQFRARLGAGRALLAAVDAHVSHRRGREAVELAGRPGEVLLVAYAQAHAVPFYIKQGYQVDGPEFDEVSCVLSRDFPPLCEGSSALRGEGR